MSPFLAAFVGGVVGGLASGLVISLVLAFYGRRVAEDLVEQQISHLEARFKESVLDVVLSKVAAYLDQGERIGQIVKRVVEIVQILVRRGAVEGLAAASLDGNGVAPGLRDNAAFAPKPAAEP